MPKKSILLVDDDVFVLHSIGDFLAASGYTITAISNPAQALGLLSEQKFDLIITDLVMGVVDGIAILRKAKKTSPLTQVLILTGYGDMPSIIEAIRLEADDYLLKPCEMEEIQFRVEKCFESQEEQRKIKAYENYLPVCAACKKVWDRQGGEDKKGAWVSVEHYLYTRAKMNASSTYCPDCFARAQEKLEKEFENN
ncbi:Response regulator receiver domain-containing protein [Desulfatibacillum alkenivorans DSM 16219]|jgi:DNA-binding NtrC family response regulator|uniref:Response regulator receiver domain-containing protein n=1 Tax=Desulfatibacillum alkenivorans DSM 16219 TaxID=1121393 RepID=A0A1M6WP85_9BACT|nr:response regulator [Desulfatibacillum alkenivorans]SHK95501.1 Response regulator receiver domain-containing protein [Desulfatibacillum alkenivorans DSM 16219]